MGSSGRSLRLESCLAYGRTTFLALAVVFVFLAWMLPNTRRMALSKWRWWVPALGALAVAIAVLAPTTATQMFDRVKANPLTDHSVRWRLAGIHAVLAGMKNGQWDTRSGLLTADATGNHLINASYEYGITGWQVQGGGISRSRRCRVWRPFARAPHERCDCRRGLVLLPGRREGRAERGSTRSGSRSDGGERSTSRSGNTTTASRRSTGRSFRSSSPTSWSSTPSRPPSRIPT